MEADYDKSIKESQARPNISVRWDTALNLRATAHFVFPRDTSDLRLMIGKPSSFSGTVQAKTTSAFPCPLPP